MFLALILPQIYSLVAFIYALLLPSHLSVS